MSRKPRTSHQLSKISDYCFRRALRALGKGDGKMSDLWNSVCVKIKEATGKGQALYRLDNRGPVPG